MIVRCLKRSVNVVEKTVYVYKNFDAKKKWNFSVREYFKAQYDNMRI